MPAHAKPTPEVFQHRLLTWYEANHRALPWRSTTEPYRIWLAEVMLQQTTVAAVIPYYERFLQRFPTLQTLAEAPLDEVLHLWQGLGYYRRAHLLHRCAQVIIQEHQGHFPTTVQGLQALPGFGAYTAAAVASCAYDTPAVAIDGNVVRVISRLFAFDEPVTPQHKGLIAHAKALAHLAPPRVFTNALMELGSQICAPKNPQCSTCPVAALCAANLQGQATRYPIKPAKKALPTHHGVAYVLQDATGHVWLRQRSASGLLAGLWEVPHTTPKLKASAPVLATTASIEYGSITHTFTHFHLVLEVRRGTVKSIPTGQGFTRANLPPLPTLMRKVLAQANLL